MNSVLVIAVLAVLALLGSTDAYTAPPAKKSVMSRSVFLKKVQQSTKDNFAKDIMNSEVEAFVKDTAGSRVYLTYRSRIARKGKELGVPVASAWARKAFPVTEPEPVEEAAEEGAAAAEAPAAE
jgi:hypothetical protein